MNSLHVRIAHNDIPVMTETLSPSKIQQTIGYLEVNRDYIIQANYSHELEALLDCERLAFQRLTDVFKHRMSLREYQQLLPHLMRQLSLNSNKSTKASDSITPLSRIHLTLPSTDSPQFHGTINRKKRIVRITIEQTKVFLLSGTWRVHFYEVEASPPTLKSKNKKTKKTPTTPVSSTREPNEQKLGTIISLLALEKSIALDFLRNTTLVLKRMFALNATLTNNNENLKTYDELNVLAHRLKGDASALQFTQVSRAAHLFENVIAEHKKLSKAQAQIDVAKNKKLIQALSVLVREIKNLNQLFSLMQKGHWLHKKNQDTQQLKSRFEQIQEHLNEETEQRLLLITENIDDKIPKPLHSALCSIITQLARNALVHGIEPESERLLMHKPGYGCLHIRFQREAKALILRVRDDGRGIDTDKIKQAALHSGLFDKQVILRCPSNQLQNLIFKSGFSTATRLNRLAGRGIGFDVVKSIISKYEGVISVRSVMHKYTEFTLRFTL